MTSIIEIISRLAGLVFGIVAVVSCLVATIWGLWFVAKKLNTIGKNVKYWTGVGLIALVVAAHYVFKLDFEETIGASMVLIFVIGAGAALLSGEWSMED
jgi:hypothetical protein